MCPIPGQTCFCILVSYTTQMLPSSFKVGNRQWFLVVFMHSLKPVSNMILDFISGLWQPLVWNFIIGTANLVCRHGFLMSLSLRNKLRLLASFRSITWVHSFHEAIVHETYQVSFYLWRQHRVPVSIFYFIFFVA